jgi:ABC-type glycerol-3-phosphate transport system substrate-binding protein
MKTCPRISLAAMIVCVASMSAAFADQAEQNDTDVIALVRFVITASSTQEQYQDFLDKRIEFFRRMPGLKRKYYTEGETPGLSIGVYHWDSRAAAMNYYDEAWHADMKKRTESYSLEIVDIEVIRDVETGEVTRF